MRFIILLLSAMVGLHYAQCAKILALFPHPGKSHHMVFEPLFEKLAQRGHEMTVASFFPIKNPPGNYTQVSFVGLADIGLEIFDMSMYEKPSSLYKLPFVGDIIKQRHEVRPLIKWAIHICEKMVTYRPLIDILKKNYDIVIVENFNSDCMLGLLHVFEIKAPVIALSSCNYLPWSADRLGFVDNPSYVPVLTSQWTDSMTFIERLKNTFLHVYLKYTFRYDIQEKEREIIEKQFGMKVPLNDLSKNLTMLMLNTFYPLNGVRPSVPGLLEVGGMYLDDTKKEIPEGSKAHSSAIVSYSCRPWTHPRPRDVKDALLKASHIT